MEYDLSLTALTASIGAMLVVLLIFLTSWSFKELKNQNKLLPPMAPITCDDVTKKTVEGTIHRYFLDMASELGLVFRIPEEFCFAHHFICCDPTLARLIFDGDSIRGIPAGEKRNEVKLINKLTMNTPSILTKLTHGEG